MNPPYPLSKPLTHRYLKIAAFSMFTAHLFFLLGGIVWQLGGKLPVAHIFPDLAMLCLSHRLQAYGQKIGLVAEISSLTGIPGVFLY